MNTCNSYNDMYKNHYDDFWKAAQTDYNIVKNDLTIATAPLRFINSNITDHNSFVLTRGVFPCFCEQYEGNKAEFDEKLR